MPIKARTMVMPSGADGRCPHGRCQTQAVRRGGSAQHHGRVPGAVEFAFTVLLRRLYRRRQPAPSQIEDDEDDNEPVLAPEEIDHPDRSASRASACANSSSAMPCPLAWAAILKANSCTCFLVLREGGAVSVTKVPTPRCLESTPSR